MPNKQKKQNKIAGGKTQTKLAKDYYYYYWMITFMYLLGRPLLVLLWLCNKLALPLIDGFLHERQNRQKTENHFKSKQNKTSSLYHTLSIGNCRPIIQVANWHVWKAILWLCAGSISISDTSVYHRQCVYWVNKVPFKRDIMWADGDLLLICCRLSSNLKLLKVRMDNGVITFGNVGRCCCLSSFG